MRTTYLPAFFIASLATVLCFSSCNVTCKKGSGHMVTENRDTDMFSKIDISGNFLVTFKQEATTSVKVTGDDNLIKDIQTEISGDRLKIRTEENICPSGQISVVIGTRNLSSVKTAGEVTFSSDGKVTTKDIDFDLSGVSKIKMELNANHVSTHGSGLTDMTLTGQAVSHKIELSGSGQLDALNFVVGQYGIESSGATDFKINVLNSLNVNTSGASNIVYRGDPKNISNNKSGIGSLKKVD